MDYCEYEDSQNCFWDAQVQGNGVGESFIDIDGTAYYVENLTIHEDVWIDGWESFPYQYVLTVVDGDEYMVVIWEGETTITCPEGMELGESNNCLETTQVAEYKQTEMLAETGTAEVVSGALLGTALVLAGIFTMMKGRKVA